MPVYIGDDGISPEQKRIYEACLEGSLKDIKDSLGTDGVAQIVKDGMMPIHVVSCSARDDFEEVIVFLLECGSEVNAQTENDGDTILHLIPRHNTIRLAFPAILKVLEYNPDVSIRNKRLRSPYDEAIALGFFELANVLDGSRDAKQARRYYEDGIGAMFGARLVDAVMNSKEDEAKECIANGANVNYVNMHGAGAIHYLFTHYEHPPENLLPLLFQAKQDPNLRDYEGDNCLNLAIKSQQLYENGNMYKIVNQLLEKGAHSTVKDLDGNDALAIATKRDYQEIVKLIRKFRPGHLSEDDENLIEPMEDDENLIEPMVKYEDPPIIHRQTPVLHDEKPVKLEVPANPPIKPAVLANKPIEPDVPTNTPIEPAVPKIKPIEPAVPKNKPGDHMPTPRMKPKQIENENNEDNKEPIKRQPSTKLEEEDDEEDDILDDPDLDVNQPNSLGLYPLHQAILRTDPVERNRLVNKLLAKGADIGARAKASEDHDEGGNTALHMAVARDQIGTVKILLQHRPMYNAPNNDGSTALDIAEKRENDEMIQILKEYGNTQESEKEKSSEKEKKNSTCAIL